MFSLRPSVAAVILFAVSSCGQSSTPPPSRQNADRPAASPPAVEQRRQAPVASDHDLSADEEMGGHTLQRHAGKSDAELSARLEREPQISSASTYTDRATAEDVVGSALSSNTRALTAWRKRTGRRPNLVLRYHAGRVIGRSMRRGRMESVPCDRAVVVLRWDERRQRDYVLTSYPEEGR
jgi:Bacterial CdiA-CT RNAse A domain